MFNLAIDILEEKNNDSHLDLVENNLLPLTLQSARQLRNYGYFHGKMSSKVHQLLKNLRGMAFMKINNAIKNMSFKNKLVSL